MDKGSLSISARNISIAWADAFLETIKPGVDEICPLTMTVTDFVDGRLDEIPFVRNALDEMLLDCSLFNTDTTANTIFPSSLWNPDFPAERLYQRYLRILPILKKIEARNRYGMYFERLIAYGEERRKQLDYIIQTYRSGNHRRSASQAAIFDPNHDQTNQKRRGFPCLQQVAFITNQHTGELSVHGFYATQYLFERGYGNLLGLARLGFFLAHEIGLKLIKVSCTASVARYGGGNRSQLEPLVEQLNDSLKELQD